MKNKVTFATDWERVWQKWEGYYIHDKIIDAIKDSMDIRNKIVLEIGCGTGADSVELAKMGANVIAFDFSITALNKTSESAKKAETNVNLVLGDAHFLPFKNNSIDLIFHQGFLEHFSDPLPLLYEQRRVIKNKGVLLVDVPQKYNLLTLRKRRAIKKGQWKYGWETEFSINELRKLITGVGFRINYEYGYNHPLSGTRVRNIDKIGRGFYGRPFFPKIIRELNEKIWKWIENRKFMLYIYESIGVIAQKCE